MVSVRLTGEYACCGWAAAEGHRLSASQRAKCYWAGWLQLGGPTTARPQAEVHIKLMQIQ